MQVNFNILNQKGAPAVYEDALANIPAPSFPGRLFVDTDITSTGIYRDTGTSWENITGGGGPGVNIYNSDGTLTSPRTLNGNYTDLSFLELGTLRFSNHPLDYGYYQTNSEIKIGDYANNYLTGTYFEIGSGIIKTSNQGNDKGIILDFANSNYKFGDISNTQGSILEIDYWNIYLKGQNNNTYFIIDDGLETIKTNHNFNDVGLNLNFATRLYQYGQITGSNQLTINVNDTTAQLYTTYQNNFRGLFLDYANNDYRIGRGAGNFSLMLLNNSTATLNFGNGTNLLAQCGMTSSQCNFGFITGGGELRFVGSAFTITGITSYTITGTGITQGTSGSASGQHLKVTINGTPYVIELKNP